MIGSISSFLAFILIWIVIIISILAATSNWQVFINYPSLLIVVGGTVISEIVARGFVRTGKAIAYAFRVMFKYPMNSKDFAQEIDRIKDWAERVQSGGKKAYDEIYSEVSDPFDKYVFSILSTGYSLEESKEFIQNEIFRESQNTGETSEILKSLGGSSPAFGMLGTLIGLVILLSQLDDPSKIGPAMAVALITTFYGLILARVLFIPGANKSIDISTAVMFRKQLILEGVVLIMQDKSSFYVEDFLRSLVDKEANGDADVANEI